jgi:hypothetical protein
METVVITIEDGVTRFLVNETTEPFLTEDATVRRASHVEPTGKVARFVFHTLRRMFGEKGIMAEFTRMWPCNWRVNLAPTGGPILAGTWRDRKLAIAAEIEYLNTNFI